MTSRRNKPIPDRRPRAGSAAAAIKALHEAERYSVPEIAAIVGKPGSYVRSVFAYYGLHSKWRPGRPAVQTLDTKNGGA